MSLSTALKTETKLSGNRSVGPVSSSLAFFDIFGLPLTVMENWRWQYGQPGGDQPLSRLWEAADSGAYSDSGLRQLADGQAAREQRWQRYRLAEHKFRRARRFAWLASHLPSVRLVAVGNSLAWSNATAESDIDLFVVTAPGTLWFTRLLLGGTLKVFGLRPTPEDQKDKLCLSFMVSEEALDLSDLRIGDDDVYFAFWLAALVPLYDAGRMMERLWQANRRILNRLPAAFPRRTARRRAVRFGKPPRASHGLGIWLARWLEPWSRQLQDKVFPERIRHLANRDSRVVVNDKVLKFHVDDRRQLFRQLHRERLSQIVR